MQRKISRCTQDESWKEETWFCPAHWKDGETGFNEELNLPAKAGYEHRHRKLKLNVPTSASQHVNKAVHDG